MEKIKLDFSGIKTKEELFAYLKNELSLPEYFGNNLDALYDCLAEKEFLIVFSNFRELKCNIGDYADSFLSVVEDSGSLLRNQ